MPSPPYLPRPGSRTFFSDQSLVIRENYGQEPATVSSPLVGKTAKASDSK